MKRLTLLLPLVLLGACSSNPPLPMPSGNAVPVNSLATSEMLAHESGYVVVGEKRHEPALRQHLLNRLGNPDDYATVPGGQLVERIFYHAGNLFTVDKIFRGFNILQNVRSRIVLGFVDIDI